MRIGKWTISFWWFPPKGRKSFKSEMNMMYDGEIHHCLCLWLIHISMTRCIEEKDK